MFDAESNAAAVKRVNRKVNDRVRRAYEHIFKSPDGRAFIAGISEACHMYDDVTSPEEEGARRMALNIRRQAVTLGLWDEWQQAEKEAADFREEMRKILAQTEAKEEEHYEI